MEPRTVKSHEKLTKRRLSTSNVIAINYILCNLIGAAVFLQAAQLIRYKYMMLMSPDSLSARGSLTTPDYMYCGPSPTPTGRGMASGDELNHTISP